MSPTLAEICRHPVKSLGEEALESVALTPGRPVPWDRVWAIAHGAAEWQDGAWAPSGTFVTQTHVPRLAQIGVALDEASGRVTLRHPDLPELEVAPGTPEGDAALTEWIAPLTEATPRKGPFTVLRADGVQFTDFEETHVSIASLSSRRALEEIAGQELAPVRFRMNLWLEGLEPWVDLELVGREIEIGPARLRVIARDARCNATAANPETGARDVPVPALLKKSFGHTDFGIYAQVVEGGTVSCGDPVRII